MTKTSRKDLVEIMLLPDLSTLGGKMKKNTKYTLIALIKELKWEAMCSGRYTSFSTKDYDTRDKSKAFRSMYYNQKVRQINALQDIISLI
jgi:hypothetical protein